MDRRHGHWQDLLASHLEELAESLECSAPGELATEMTAIAAEAKSHLPLLGETLADIVTSLQQVLVECNTLTDAPKEQPVNQFHRHRHRDWREAGRAAIRAALAIAAVGVTWSVSGWAQGPLMLMASSIMISIFSTKEHPAAFVGNIFIGAAIGSAVAVFCRAVLLQGVTRPLLAGIIGAPFQRPPFCPTLTFPPGKRSGRGPALRLPQNNGNCGIQAVTRLKDTSRVNCYCLSDLFDGIHVLPAPAFPATRVG